MSSLGLLYFWSNLDNYLVSCGILRYLINLKSINHNETRERCSMYGTIRV